MSRNKSFFKKILSFETHDEEDAQQKAEKLLFHAHKKAQRIITEAFETAKQSVINTDLLNQKLESDVKLAFQTVTEKYVNLIDREFSKLFGDFKANFVAKSQEVIDRIEKSADQRINDFAALLDQKMSDQLNKQQEYLLKYKEEKIKTIDQQVSKLVIQLSKEVLRKSISQNDHEELIVEALERAKKDGLFSEILS